MGMGIRTGKGQLAAEAAEEPTSPLSDIHPSLSVPYQHNTSIPHPSTYSRVIDSGRQLQRWSAAFAYKARRSNCRSPWILLHIADPCMIAVVNAAKKPV
ncbi:hypothetical protein NUW54_g9117 [Trametes sanguinea]|uniref:Uncharacterized protein n=1 Tax=Trametes sanguinea TaxID=158606 RepID=A0ACC1PA41_9APHY|nr:hypothetical protein NUW54_g9117 [Trametes sanguinea]